MAEMRRMTVVIPDELDKRLMELKKDDRFIRCSYSELVRRMLVQGMDAERTHKTASGGEN